MISFFSKKNPDLLLHQIHRMDDFSGRTNLCANDQFIQCASLKMQQNDTFKPHYHVWKRPTFDKMIAQESWVVISGRRTYVSVPMQIKHAGCALSFRDYEWSGQYNLQGTRIWDAAVRWNKGMFVGEDALQVVSFQLKKRVPIGRGGMVLTDDKEAADWIRLASYDGRDLTTDYTDPNHFRMLGYHMYMTPEDAARGIILMDKVPEDNDDSGDHLSYTDLTTLTIF